MTGEFFLYYDDRPSDRVDPAAFTHLRTAAERFFADDRDAEMYLDHFNGQRPLIGAALIDETTMPETLDMLTRFSNAPATYRRDTTLTHEAHWRSAQITLVHSEHIREIADGDIAGKGDQALHLLFASAQHMGADAGGEKYLIDNLFRAVQSEVRMYPNDASRIGPKYAAAVDKLLRTIADNDSLDQLLDAAASLESDPQTADAGQAISSQIARSYNIPELKNADAYASTEQLEADRLRNRASIHATAYFERLHKSKGIFDPAELQHILEASEQVGAEGIVWMKSLEAMTGTMSRRRPPYELAAMTLEYFGLDYNALLADWEVGSLPSNPREWDRINAIHANLSVIRELEKAEPGSAKVLREEFGIRNFQRYPLNMLLRQYRERDNKDIPYGVMIYSVSDHNQAFKTNSRLIEFNQRVSELGHLVRIYECATPTEALRALLRARWRYQQPLAFALGLAHGFEDSISYTGSRTKNELSRSQVQRAYRSQAWERNRYGTGKPKAAHPDSVGSTPLWAKYATGGLISCSTGVKYGIGDAIAAFLYLPLTAPTMDTNISRIDVTAHEGGGLELTMTYLKDAARQCGNIALNRPQ